MKRALAWLSGLLGVLVLIVIALLAFVLGTERGLRMAYAQAERLLPQGVSIAAIDGRLTGPLTLRDIAVQTPTYALHIAHLHLDWQPGALWNGVLRVRELALSGIEYRVQGSAPDEPDQGPVQLPQRIGLPVALDLQQVRVEDVHIVTDPAAQPFVIHRAQFGAQADADGAKLDPVRIEAELFDVQGQLRTALAEPYAIDAALQWTLRPPGYPAAAAATTLSGTWQAPRLVQTIAAPYGVELTAKVANALNQPEIDARLTVAGIALQQLDPTLAQVRISADLQAQGPVETLSIGGRLAADTADFGPVFGRVQAQFDAHLVPQQVVLEQLTVALSPSGGELRAQGELAYGGPAPRFSVRGEWTGLRWPPVALEPVTPEPTAAGAVAASVDAAADAAADTDADEQTAQPVLLTSERGRFEAGGTPEDLRFSLAARLGPDGEIEADGARQGEAIEANARWTALAWPDPALSSPAGQIALKGRLDDYALTADATLTAPEQPQASLTLAGHGSLERFAIDALDIAALEGRLHATGEIAWAPELRGELRAEGENLNPAVLAPAWPGRLALRLSARGGMVAGQPEGEVAQLAITGTLRQRPVEVQARASYAADAGLKLPQLTARSGNARLTAQGGWTPARAELQFETEIPQLAGLAPAAAGSVAASGRLSGDPQAPHIELHAQARELRYTDHRLAQLDLTAAVDLSGGPLSLRLTAAQGESGGVQLQRLVLTADGALAQHQLALDADSSLGQAALALSGEYAAPQWRYTLREGRIAPAGYPPWTLLRPAAGEVGPVVLRLEQSCWQTQPGRLCLSGAQRDGRTEAEFALTDFAWSYLAAALPPDLRVTGTVDASGQYTQESGQAPQAQGRLQLGATTLAIRPQPQEPFVTLLDTAPSAFNAELQASGRAALEGALELPAGPGLTIDVAAGAGATPAERALSGTVRMRLDNLGFLAPLAPQARIEQGALAGAIDLSGTLAAPALQGQIALRDGAVQIPAAGITLRELGIEARGRPDGVIELTGAVRSGEGRLQLDGQVNPTAQPITADLRLTGENFRAVDLAEARVDLTPALAAVMDAGGTHISGELRIPQATITLNELPPSAVEVSEDQVIVGQDTAPAADTSPPLPVSAEVRLILGENVSFSGFGLSAELDGNVLIRETPSAPTTASGEIVIEQGAYKAYGQNLGIERGLIVFAGGPVTQPGIDLRAVRRPAEGIKVGVEVRGRLEEPQLTLFSEPSMPQTEQLSYLLLGRAPSGGGDADNAVARAALALGLSRSEGLVQGIGEKLGFDQVGIESGSGAPGEDTDPEQASLVLGKYLSPKLYVSYGIGLFEPINTFRVQYLLSSRWKLVTESSGRATGGDLVYSLERGD